MDNYLLGGQDVRKIGKGLLIAVAGAALTYLSQVVGKLDFGVYTPAVVALFSVLVNVAYKVLDGKVK